LGIVVVNLVGASDKLSWRGTAGVGAGICGLLCILIWLVPEPKPSGPAAVTARTGESVWSAKWIQKLVIVILFMLFQQFSGINAIVANTNDLFKGAGLQGVDKFAGAVATSAQVIACLLASFLIQRFGRKIIWIASFAGVAVTDILFGVTQVERIKGRKHIRRCSVAFMFLNLFAFGVGAGPIPWFIVPEMFADALPDTAMSIASAANWLFVFLVVGLFDIMKNPKPKGMGGDGSFFLYGAISAIAAVFGAIFVPKGGPKEETYTVVTEEQGPATRSGQGEPLLENKDL
jgi:MFS family permease